MACFVDGDGSFSRELEVALACELGKHTAISVRPLSSNSAMRDFFCGCEPVRAAGGGEVCVWCLRASAFPALPQLT